MQIKYRRVKSSGETTGTLNALSDFSVFEFCTKEFPDGSRRVQTSDDSAESGFFTPLGGYLEVWAE